MSLRVEQVEDRVMPAGTGLAGQYFNNADFTTSVLTRTDADLDFEWGSGSPDASVGADTFSVRWTGEIEPRFSETYTFTLTADDGAALWINNQLVVSRDRYSSSVTSFQGSIDLTAGVRVPIRVEYNENTGSASLKLSWQSASQGREIVPMTALYPGTALDDRGSIRQSAWNVGTIAAMTASADYPSKPANRDALVTLESLVQNAGDGIARRVVGRLVPSITGSYTFAISGDDQAELWLSTDTTEANAVKIAFTNTATPFRNFTTNASQISAPVNLVAGQQYFLKVLHADAGGTDHFSAAWQPPGDTALSVIPGDVLIPAGYANTQPTQANLLNTLSTAHPYLFTSPERFERVRQLITGGQPQTWWNGLKAQADAMLTAAVNYYHLPDGVRLLSISRSVLDRVSTLALAYQITGDTAYAERAWLELDAINNFPDWHPAHFLDVAEMTHAAAIGYDWLYNYWTQSRRDAIRTAIVNFGLTPGLSQYTGNASWTKPTNNNWNLVCNGGLSAGALAIAADEPTLSADILNRALNSLRPMMAHFTTDNGGWYEGPGYWGYATQYLIQFLDGFETGLGSDFAVARTEGFDRTGMVPVQMVGPTKLSFNFADSNPGNVSGSQLFWLARRFNEPIYAAHERANASSSDPSPFDLLRYDSRGQSAAALGTPLDEAFIGPTKTNTYSPMEVVTLRSDWTSQASWIGFKGAGKVGDSHGHLDAGSFVFDAHGTRWAHDLGSDDYNLPNYFGSDRWNYYRLRAEGQNTLVINPGSGPDQVTGAAAPIVLHSDEPGADRAMSIADLTAAYTGTSRVWRGMQLLNNREELLVQDEIVASTAVSGWWFMHVKLTPSQIVIAPDGRSAILTQGTDRLYVKIVNGTGTLTLRDPAPLPTSPNPSGQNANAGYEKLAIQLTNVTNERLSVWMVPLAPGEEVPTTSPAIVALSSWGKSLNDPPRATAQSTNEDAVLDIDLFTQITDFETPSARLRTTVGTANNGTAVLQPDGRTLRFTPAANYSGPASVNVTVSDEGVDSRLLFAYDFEPPAATLSSTVSDFSGNEREGTLSTIGTGAFARIADVPAALAGDSTQSLNFTEAGSGNGARLRRAIPTFNFNTQNWTFSTWFKRSGNSNDDFLFYLGDNTGFGGSNELQLYGNSGGNNLILRHYDGATLDANITATNILPNVWHHAAVTFNTSGVLSLYVNGTLIGSDTAFTLNMATTQGPILGGSGSTTASTHRWLNGSLDDAALFSSTLGASDIAKLAAGTVAQLGGQTTALTIPITVNAVNDPPAAVGPSTAVTTRNTFIDVDLRSLTSDIETPIGQILFAVTGATNGTAVLLADGFTVRFTPAANYTGPATFTYTATDTWADSRTRAYYTFDLPDSVSDGVVTDQSNGNADAAVALLGTGTATDTSSAKFGGQAVALTNPSDGNGARIITPLTMNDFDFNDADWSVSGWFYRTGNSNDDAIFYIGASDMYGAHELWLTGLSGQDSVRLQHDSGSAGADVQITKTGVATNAWHHFAATLDADGSGGGTLRLYVNGALVGSDSAFSLNMPSTSNLVFGGHASTTFATYRWFGGRLDDFAVYDGALSAAEVSSLAAKDVRHAFGQVLTRTVNVSVIPAVTGTVINGGAVQRSRVHAINLTFASAFDVSALSLPNALTLTRIGGPALTVGNGIAVTPASGTASTLTLTFTGAGAVTSGSLTDGYWTLRAGNVTVLSNLRRLTGDSNNDGTVDATDFGALGAAFGYPSNAFDFNQDGTTDATDLAVFGNGFGRTL